MIVLQIIVFLLGLGLALTTLQSAIKQTVLPGRKRVRLSRTLFRTTFRLFRFVFVRIQSDAVRDALSAFYAPMSVMLLPITWAILLMIGFTMMFWGVSEPSLGTSLFKWGSHHHRGVPRAERGSPDHTLQRFAEVLTALIEHCGKAREKVFSTNPHPGRLVITIVGMLLSCCS